MATELLWPTTDGAALLHRPITRVPENTLKRLVGAMLSGFGTFRVGEGAGLVWPGGDTVHRTQQPR